MPSPRRVAATLQVVPSSTASHAVTPTIHPLRSFLLRSMDPHISSHLHVKVAAAPAPGDGACKAKEEYAIADLEAARHSADPSGGGDVDGVNYMARAQWLRAAVLGANDGLVSVASIMMGVSAVNAKAMLVSGLAGLVAGACSMAIGEFVSVYAQYDIELSQIKRTGKDDDPAAVRAKKKALPSPTMAAFASALAFAVGALLPLLAGGFIKSPHARIMAVCAGTTVGLAGFGAAGAYLGGASLMRSGLRVLIGGWLAMAVTYGVLRLFVTMFHMQASSLG